MSRNYTFHEDAIVNLSQSFLDSCGKQHTVRLGARTFQIIQHPLPAQHHGPPGTKSVVLRSGYSYPIESYSSVELVGGPWIGSALNQVEQTISQHASQDYGASRYLQVSLRDPILPSDSQPLDHLHLPIASRIDARVPCIGGDDTHGQVCVRTGFGERRVHPVGAVGVDPVPHAADLETGVLTDERLRLTRRWSALS